MSTPDDALIDRLHKRAQQLYDGWKVRTDDTIAAIANELSESAEAIQALRARAAELERGEFICRKCGMRKDDEHDKPDF